jgi:hypothetical protein
MLTADGLKHLAPQAGQAATDMARGAKAAGENLAGTRQDRNTFGAETLNSVVDAPSQKADEDAQAQGSPFPERPAWFFPSQSDSDGDAQSNGQSKKNRETSQ